MKINTSSPFARALLVLLPVAGCGVLAWQGAHRPERLIIGTWRVEGSEHSFEFRDDGTFVEVESQTIRETPYLELSRLRTVFWRTTGRYSFPSRSLLRLQLDGPRVDTSPTPTPISQPTASPSTDPALAPMPTPPRFYCGTSALDVSDTPGELHPSGPSHVLTITFEDDAAHATDALGSGPQVWRRTEAMVVAPTIVAVPTPTSAPTPTAAPIPTSGPPIILDEHMIRLDANDPRFQRAMRARRGSR